VAASGRASKGSVFTSTPSNMPACSSAIASKTEGTLVMLAGGIARATADRMW